MLFIVCMLLYNSLTALLSTVSDGVVRHISEGLNQHA